MIPSLLPHRICIADEPHLLFLSVLADALIATAYFAISSFVFRAAHKKLIGVILGSTIWYMFAVFIFMCGCTHLMDIAIIWYPVYWYQVTISLFTASVSLITAALLIPTVIVLLRNRPMHLFEAHRKLESAKGSSPYLDRLQEMMRLEDPS